MPVTIDSITTTDAAPAAAPHRISNKATKDAATVAFTPNDEGLLPTADTGSDADLLPEETSVLPSATLFPSATLYPGAGGLLPDEDGAPVLAYRFTTSSIGPYAGDEVSHRGRVATPALACSEILVCEDFESPSGVQLTEEVEYAELAGPPADGALPVNVWVNFAGAWL